MLGHGSLLYISCLNNILTRPLKVEKRVLTHYKYVAKFLVVGRQLVTMLSYHDAQKLRKVQYMLGSKGLPHREIRNVL